MKWNFHEQKVDCASSDRPKFLPRRYRRQMMYNPIISINLNKYLGWIRMISLYIKESWKERVVFHSLRTQVVKLCILRRSMCKPAYFVRKSFINKYFTICITCMKSTVNRDLLCKMWHKTLPIKYKIFFMHFACWKKKNTITPKNWCIFCYGFGGGAKRGNPGTQPAPTFVFGLIL